MPTEMRLAAQSYWERGWSVIPLEPSGKKPLLPWKRFQNERATPDELDEWFSDDGPNIGLVTGSISGFAVLDVDSPDAMRFALKWQEGRGLGDEDTPSVKTGKGWHIYYTYPAGLRNLQAHPEWPGIDLRGEGGYVVAPPSVHESGHMYFWESGEKPMIPMPDWMTLYSRKRQQPRSQSNPSGPLPAIILPEVYQGRRNSTVASLAGFLIQKGFAQPQVLAMVLGWNQNNRPPLDVDEVRGTVESIYRTHARNTAAPTEPEGLEL